MNIDNDKKNSCGEWYSAEAIQNETAMYHRSIAFNSLKKSSLNMTEIEIFDKVESLYPNDFLPFGLYTWNAGHLKLIGTAFILEDAKGPLLITAKHVVCDADHKFRMELSENGLIAMSLDSRTFDIQTRTWSLYSKHDVAMIDLSKEEALILETPIFYPHTEEVPKLWVAYGLPGSKNKQRRKDVPFKPNGTRIGLYTTCDPPKAFNRSPNDFVFFKYPRKKVHSSNAKRTEAAPTTKGYSGGLVAGYIESLHCWIPYAVIIEFHHEENILVAARLDKIFKPAIEN